MSGSIVGGIPLNVRTGDVLAGRAARSCGVRLVDHGPPVLARPSGHVPEEIQTPPMRSMVVMGMR